MRWVAAFILALFILWAFSGRANAQFSDIIDDVAVPVSVSINVQTRWQGYIIYSMRQSGGTYTATLARDDSPHQYPLRIITFTQGWELISDSGLVTPAPPEPEEEVVEEPEEDTPEPDPMPPEVPEPPVVRPPEPEEEPEEDEEEPEDPEEEEEENGA